MLARMADVDHVINKPGDRIDRDEGLPFAEAQEATGGDLHEADLLRDIIDQEAFDLPKIQSVLVLDHTPADIFGRACDGPIGVAQSAQRVNPLGGVTMDPGLVGGHERSLLSTMRWPGAFDDPMPTSVSAGRTFDVATIRVAPAVDPSRG
jgi:hypothetical protein